MDVLLNLPMKEQEESFKKFPLAKQVDVYVEAMYVEPPQTRYAGYLASNGRQVLPFLMDRLRKEKSDTAKTFLLYAFEVIHQKHYSLTKEGGVREDLKTAISGMSDTYRRQQAEEYLKTILEQPGAQ
jgi:hypothetical protein